MARVGGRTPVGTPSAADGSSHLRHATDRVDDGVFLFGHALLQLAVLVRRHSGRGRGGETPGWPRTLSVAVLGRHSMRQWHGLQGSNGLRAADGSTFRANFRRGVTAEGAPAIMATVC